jgi:hypothetical protein
MTATRINEPIQPLGNMRANGVRSLDVTCWQCHHRAILSADPWSDDVPVPTFGPLEKIDPTVPTLIRYARWAGLRGSVPYKDPEKRREGIRKWRAANRERIRETSLKWRTANPDKIRQSARAYRETNREKVRAQQRKYAAAKRARAKERGDPDATG